MALSRLAAHFAAEILLHDWSDAPWRADRAGHRRELDGRNATDRQLKPDETDLVRLNVAWVVGQVLAYLDVNIDVHEFAEAAGVAPRLLRNKDGRLSGTITQGLRFEQAAGGPRRYCRPGTFTADPVE